jgi:hypothetical protein
VVDAMMAIAKKTHVLNGINPPELTFLEGQRNKTFGSHSLKILNRQDLPGDMASLKQHPSVFASFKNVNFPV